MSIILNSDTIFILLFILITYGENLKKTFFLIEYGCLKNNKLIFLTSLKLRPTKNIIKKSLYSWIIYYINSLYIIDFFSGTGIICFNLFSNGAKKIIMLEQNKLFFKYINLNKIKLNLYNNFFIYLFDSMIWLKNLNILNVSLIIIDPPYIYNLYNFLLQLNAIFFLKKYLLIFLETNKHLFFKNYFLDIFLLKKKQSGQTKFYFLKKI